MLWDRAYFGADGHEIVVMLPARNNVEVEVFGDAGTGYFAQIESDVQSIRGKMTTENSCAAVEELHQGLLFIGGQFSDIGKVPSGGCQQVTVGIGKAIEQHHR